MSSLYSRSYDNLNNSRYDARFFQVKKKEKNFVPAETVDILWCPLIWSIFAFLAAYKNKGKITSRTTSARSMKRYKKYQMMISHVVSPDPFSFNIFLEIRYVHIIRRIKWIAIALLSLLRLQEKKGSPLRQRAPLYL